MEPHDIYRSIREEIRAEHGLIANRLTWYVTSQSFLVSAFAISQANGFRWFPWFSSLLLPGLGFVTSALIFPSIHGAVQTIRRWHEKQSALLSSAPALAQSFRLERPAWIEHRGLLFPKLLPFVFALFWLTIALASYFA